MKGVGIDASAVGVLCLRTGCETRGRPSRVWGACPLVHLAHCVPPLLLLPPVLPTPTLLRVGRARARARAASAAFAHASAAAARASASRRCASAAALEKGALLMLQLVNLLIVMDLNAGPDSSATSDVQEEEGCDQSAAVASTQIGEFAAVLPRCLIPGLQRFVNNKYTFTSLPQATHIDINKHTQPGHFASSETQSLAVRDTPFPAFYISTAPSACSS